MKHRLAPWCSRPVEWLSSISSCSLAFLAGVGLGGTTHATVILQDNFEYVADRNVTNVQIPFEARGWTDLKATNSDRASGSGYLYTRQDTTLNSRVLVMESLPTTSPCLPWCQTDYFLKYGDESHPLGTIPANVWFQFWTYATPGSAWDGQKFLYPCFQSYPCPSESYLWLSIMQSGFQGVPGPAGGRYFIGRSAFANNAASPDQDILYQNLNNMHLAVGTWYQVRMHFDTSGPQGSYELWVRQRGVSTWTKLAEWIGGVTPNFTWPIPATLRNGNKMLAMPTTVDTYDSTTYMDDFIMATSVNDFGGLSSDTIPPAQPRNVRIVQ